MNCRVRQAPALLLQKPAGHRDPGREPVFDVPARRPAAGATAERGRWTRCHVGMRAHNETQAVTAGRLFNRHLQTPTEPTHSCAAAYDCARIRWLVRLRAGLYRSMVAEKQRSGLVARQLVA
jgi:hypothetical protein